MIVDDHFIVRIGLRSSLKLEATFKVVAEAGTGAQALEAYRRHLPDVVLLDLRLPDFSGIEVTARLLQEFPDARVIIISSYDAVEQIHRAFQAGARGYLLKDVLDQELFRAIKAVHGGDRYVPAEVARCLAQAGPEAEFTTVELQALELLLRGQTDREIGGQLGLPERAVGNQIQSTLAKLGVNKRAQAAAAALQRGLLLWRPAARGPLSKRVVFTRPPEA